MITIDATNLTSGFSITNSASGSFASYVSHDANSYTWLDLFGSTITLTGTGITVDANNIPSGGTITGLSFTFVTNSSGTPDMIATGLNFALTDLDFTGGASSNETFWQTVLDGDIGTYLGPVDNGSSFLAGLAGDFGTLSAGTFEFAGDDVYTGAGGPAFFAGDGLLFSGAQVRGGNDTIQGDFGFGIGDLQNVSGTALLIAGDDTFRVTGPITTASLTAYGDAIQVFDDAFVQGGADDIDLSGSINVGATIYGDVQTVSTRGVVTAGEDSIRGTQQDDIIGGDVGTLRDDAALFAANDTIYGEGGDDEIYGDVRDVFDDAEVLRDGDDFIDGGAGNDSLFGNGGDDTLLGGTGKDKVKGQDGDDTIAGGNGRDRLEGGSGDDTINGGKGHDRLEGGTDNDSLSGGKGDDRLSGNAGTDTLKGGDGDDQLAGGNNADIFEFSGNFGNDTITDFSLNPNEKIDLSGVAAITDFADLMDDHIDDTSGTVVIADGAGNTITLDTVFSVSSLDADDFIF